MFAATTSWSDDDLAHARRWLQLASPGPIATQLEAIYAHVTNQITARGPACWASGRCCNFAKTGHLLYVTGFEAAYTLLRLGTTTEAPSPPTNAARAMALSQLSASTLALAQARGDCPFLHNNLCGAHTIKPLGCRVYFCDRSAQTWQHDLTESGLQRLRALHDTHDIPYRYGEWRSLLSLVLAAQA